MTVEPHDSASPQTWQKWVITGFGVLAVAHAALLMLWLAPSSPIRSSVGSTNLASYVDPYFQQSNDTVGLGAQYVDESFSIRAYVRHDVKAKPTLTKWLDVTMTEDRSSGRDPDPARVHLIARRLAANLNLAMFGLEPAQRKFVRKIAADDTTSDVRVRLESAGKSQQTTRTFQAYDQMATQFASLYARSAFKSDVLQVQFRVGRRTVPPYAQRDSKILTDVPFLFFDFGWRPAFRGSVEARTAFDSYVKK
ncbi:DUF5819 family protein [Aeromicrobium sp.]|uniref:DUF5819 family protein n=1 Tax=Aeromicrobium sp. TaxID=1871063 RepID=UPI0019AF5F05|nr:DUF5819 family protein [Aeromicrobium sp.]MBC7632388.1 hypothetical protein [Aeromicrobium sp.]